jgi:hypothetical protein
MVWLIFVSPFAVTIRVPLIRRTRPVEIDMSTSHIEFMKYAVLIYNGRVAGGKPSASRVPA